MAPLGQYLCLRKVIFLYLFLFLFTSSVLVLANTEEDQKPNQKKTITSSTKNQTKLIKPTTNSPKNQTNLIKPTTTSPQNQTKLIKTTTNSPKNQTNFFSDSSKNKNKNKTKLIKPTSDPSKSPNSTKPSSDLTKSSTPKNETTKPITPKLKTAEKKQKIEEEEDEDDFVSEFRDLPNKVQETFLPDLERISTTSQVYLNKANKQITKGFNPIVGKKYAPTIASIVSFAFILIPFLLVSLIFNRIKAYFSLQKLLIFIQIYLSIYFAILCFSSLVTGLEPLKFFYATSQSTYVCLQVLQTLAYVLYLLLLLMYLVLVFSTETGSGTKFMGLGQIFVGFAVGLHYYVTVFHRVVMHQPPKTNWKIYGIYATCFLVICLLAGAERRKKAYSVEDGEEGKKS